MAPEGEGWTVPPVSTPSNRLLAPTVEDDAFGRFAPVYLVIGSMSLVAAAVVSAVFRWSTTRQKDTASKIILLVTLFDVGYTVKFMVSAIAWLAGARETERSFHLFADKCITSAGYGQFFSMACISWNAAWIINFLLTLQSPMRNNASDMRWYHLVVWPSALITAVYVMTVMGRDDPQHPYNCWIHGDNTDMYVFQVPLYIYVALGVLSLVYAFWRLRSGTAASLHQRRALMLRHGTYVVAFVLLWLWPIIHHFLDKADKLYSLAMVDSVIVSGQGCLFAIIRMMEPGARAGLVEIGEHFKSRLVAVCCRCRFMRRTSATSAHAQYGANEYLVPTSPNMRQPLLPGADVEDVTGMEQRASAATAHMTTSVSMVKIHSAGRSDVAVSVSTSSVAASLSKSPRVISSSYTNPLLAVQHADMPVFLGPPSVSSLNSLNTNSASPHVTIAAKTLSISRALLPPGASPARLGDAGAGATVTDLQLASDAESVSKVSTHSTYVPPSLLDADLYAGGKRVDTGASAASAWADAPITTAMFMPGTGATIAVLRQRSRSDADAVAPPHEGEGSGIARNAVDESQAAAAAAPAAAAGTMGGADEFLAAEAADEVAPLSAGKPPLPRRTAGPMMQSPTSGGTFDLSSLDAVDAEGNREFSLDDIALRNIMPVDAGAGAAAIARQSKLLSPVATSTSPVARPTFGMAHPKLLSAPRSHTELGISPSASTGALSSPSSAPSPSVPSPSFSSPSLSAAAPLPFNPQMRLGRTVSSDALSSSTATGWDIGYALRLEEALCMLSGLCQSVLRADAQRRVQEELNISCDDTCSHLSLKADARSRESAHGGAHAVPPHRDLSAWLKDASSVMEEMTLLQEIDCDSFLSIALARMRDAAAARAHSGCGAGPLLLTHSVTATGTAGPVPGATLSVAVSAGVRRNDNARFEFVSFADDLFAAVREASALSAAQVVYSLDPVLLRSNRLRAHFSEGASSSFFCRSLDQLLVVKTISETEVKELLRLMPAYVRHLATNPSSLLCRFYGCYSLKLPSSSRAFFLVMGNAFPITDPGPCAETYDLKGSTVGRRARVSKSVTSRGKKGEVLSKGMIFQDMEFRERFPSGLPACDASQLVHELRSGRAPFEAALQAIALGDAPDAALASASVSGESTEHAVHALFGGGPAVTDGSSLLRSLDEGGELHDLTMSQAVAHAHPMDTTSLRAPLNDAPHTQSAWGGGSRTLSVDGGIERSRAIVAQLQSDVALLASHGLMDYSLLVNIMPVSEDDMSSADALSDATSSGLLVEDIAELLAALQEQEADTVLADASIDRRDVGVLYSLSLNKAPSLRYADALSLVQAATALPLHIASVGRPIPLIASAVTIPSAVTATAAAGASWSLTGRITRWSPLAVSLCSLGSCVHFTRTSSSGSSSGAGSSAAARAPPKGGGLPASGLRRGQSGGTSSSAVGAPTASGGGDRVAALMRASAHGSVGSTMSAMSDAEDAAAPSTERPLSASSSPPLLSPASSSPSPFDVMHEPLQRSNSRSSTRATSAPAPERSSSTASLEAAAGGLPSPRSAAPIVVNNQLPSRYHGRALVQIGIIDVLQAYDVSKRVENTFKSLRHGVLHANMDANISSVNPKQYARRFLDFARDIFITHSVTK